MVQLSHPSMTTRKTIALTILHWQCLNMLSRFVIAFLTRSKHFNFLAAVTICNDFGAQENKVSHSFHCFPIYVPWSNGARCHDLSEKAMAPHSSTFAWRIPWMEEPGRLQSMGLLRVGHDWATSLSPLTFMHWRRKWQPTPVFLPGESQGRGSLVGCRLWGRRVGHDWSNLAAAACLFT